MDSGIIYVRMHFGLAAIILAAAISVSACNSPAVSVSKIEKLVSAKKYADAAGEFASLEGRMEKISDEDCLRLLKSFGIIFNEAKDPGMIEQYDSFFASLYSRKSKELTRELIDISPSEFARNATEAGLAAYGKGDVDEALSVCQDLSGIAEETQVKTGEKLALVLGATGYAKEDSTLVIKAGNIYKSVMAAGDSTFKANGVILNHLYPVVCFSLDGAARPAIRDIQAAFTIAAFYDEALTRGSNRETIYKNASRSLKELMDSQREVFEERLGGWDPYQCTLITDNGRTGMDGSERIENPHIESITFSSDMQSANVECSYTRIDDYSSDFDKVNYRLDLVYEDGICRIDNIVYFNRYDEPYTFIDLHRNNEQQ